MLQKKLTDRHYSQILEKIEVQTDRVSRIVKNLLNFARNPSESAFHKVNVVENLQEIISLIDYKLKAMNIRLEMTTAPGQAHLGPGRTAAAGVHQHHPQRPRRHARRRDAGHRRDGRRQGCGRPDLRHGHGDQDRSTCPISSTRSSRPRASARGRASGCPSPTRSSRSTRGDISVSSETGAGSRLLDPDTRRPGPQGSGRQIHFGAGMTMARPSHDPCHRRRARHPRRPGPAAHLGGLRGDLLLDRRGGPGETRRRGLGCHPARPPDARPGRHRGPARRSRRSTLWP